MSQSRLARTIGQAQTSTGSGSTNMATGAVRPRRGSSSRRASAQSRVSGVLLSWDLLAEGRGRGKLIRRIVLSQWHIPDFIQNQCPKWTGIDRNCVNELFSRVRLAIPTPWQVAKNGSAEMASTFSHWPNGHFDLSSAIVPLPEAILDDLMGDEDQCVAVATRDWASTLMDRHVYSRNGFFIIDGGSYPCLDPDQRIHMTKRLAPCLGKPIVHHSRHLKQDLVTNVKDAGVRFKSSKDQNFSSSNQEAVEHTESTELPNPIGAFLLHSIHPAYKGGASRFVNAYTLLDSLAGIDPGHVEVLQRPFCFDTARGERVEAPIVSYDDNGNLDFRWMHAFLENGRPFTKHWNDKVQGAIDATRNLMKELRITVMLGQGDIIVVNNKMMLHARDGFENHPDHPPRWLLRSWFE